MPVQIRDIRLGDYLGVCSLMGQVHSLHSRNRPDMFTQTDNPMPFHAFTGLFDNEDTIALVGEADDKVVAVCLVTIRQIRNHPAMANRRMPAWRICALMSRIGCAVSGCSCFVRQWNAPNKKARPA